MSASRKESDRGKAEKMLKEFHDCAQEMMDFIEKSPTCFHATANLKEMLDKEGFLELREAQEWSMEGGKGYYVTRNDSSLIAFRIPVLAPQVSILRHPTATLPRLKSRNRRKWLSRIFI